jgi:hypothetical protein
MPEPLKFELDGDCRSRADLPYRLELWDDRDGGVSAVLALCSSPGVAHAAYFAALREHLGRTIVLKNDGRLIASSGDD